MRFTKGLNRDVDPSVQPEGTYRTLTNGIVTDDQGTIQIEDGTEIVESLSGNIRGDIILSNNTVVLFIDTGSTYEIRLFNGSSTSLIAKSSELNLTSSVVGTHTVDNNGDTIIYWTDGVNPPRFINIDNPPVDGSSIINVDIENLNIFPTFDSSNPSFSLDSVNDSGGSLEAGVYYLTFAYIDEDNTLTDYFLVTNPISILGPSGVGAREDTETSKSIKFTLSNLDTNYDRVRVSSIRETNVENIIDIPIPSTGSIAYNYTANEGSTTGSLDEVVINSPIYNKANALEQHDNNLYLGGLNRKDLTRSQKESLQSAAINCNLSSITKTVSNSQFFSDSKNAFDNRSFKRGEVYAFYLSFILKDGRETEAFHIPGRDPQTGIQNSQSVLTINNIDLAPNQASEGNQTFLDVPDNGTPALGGWNTDLSPSSIPSTSQNINIRFEDSGGSNLFQGITTYSYTINTTDNISTQMASITDDMNANYLDSNWVANETGSGGFQISSSTVGSSNNNTANVLLDIATDESYTWTSIDDGDSIVASDGYVEDSIGGGTDNSAYTGTIDFTFNPDGFTSYNVSITPDTDTLSWGSEGVLLGGDSALTVAEKFSALFNDTTNASSGSHTSFFSTLQGDYTFSVDGLDRLVATAINNSSDYDGTWTVENSQIVSGSPNTNNLTGGYNQSEGVDITIDLNSINGISGTTPVTKNYTSGSISTFVSTFVSDLNSELSGVGVTDLTVTSSGNEIILTEDDTNGSYVGESVNTVDTYPSVQVTGGVYQFTNEEFTSVTNFDETGDITDPVSAKEYQVFSRPDNIYNFGYWENKNETYPNEEPWITEGLNGQNVTHHHFPDGIYGNQPYNLSTGELNITGVEVDGISITDQSLHGEIVGYKLYYAKKNSGNQLVLSQASINNGWVDRQSTSSDETNDGYKGARPYQQYDAIFSEDQLVTHGFDELSDYDTGLGYQTGEEWGSDTNFGYCRPADILQDVPSVSGLSFIKGIYKTVNSHRDIDQINISNSSRVLDGGDLHTESIKAKAYVDVNQRNIDLRSNNFSYDMDNLFGESKVVLEFDNPYGNRGERVVCDLCQLFDDVHVPFYNQQLVDTGFKGSIDSNGNQVNSPSDDIFGGDIYIGDNYFRANTLLSLAEERAWTAGKADTDSDNSWWGRDYGVSDTTQNVDENASYPDSPMANYYLKNEAETYLFVDNIDYADARSIEQATIEIIGSTGTIRSLPYGYSTLYREIVESRINTTIRYSGEQEFEAVYPQDQDWSSRPNSSSFKSVEGLDQGESAYQFTRWWQQYFTNWDNYYEFNDQYNSLQDLKTSFPWNPYEIIQTNNLNRVIRSAGDEDGRSQSFRLFRENDFLDLPRNRGDITNLENVENTLLIHMDRALIYTRGREELRTQDFEVFLGNGDIFSVKPNEVLITDAGYAGLQDNQASVNCKYGYFFVDQQDNKVLWMSQQGIKDLTTKQYGLHNFFREDFNSDNCIVGYDSNRERVIISSDSHTLTFNPDLQIWSSFLSYTPDYFIRTLNRLFTHKNNNLYRHKELVSDIYGENIIFNITYSVPNGFDGKLKYVWFNADNINSSGSITQELPFNTIRIENSHQDTGEITLTDYSTNPSDITSRGNTRKSQGVWKINNLRTTETNNNLPSWANKKRLQDDYHIVKLEYTNSNNGFIILKASNLETNQVIK